jgi:CMP-N-acetylneuraminic acid synthetase
MLAVVQHALTAVPGDPEDIFVLLQPTAPFRTPAHVTEAIRLLRETQADSVVSVVEVPENYRPDLLMWVGHHVPGCDGRERMMSFMGAHAMEYPRWSPITRRQDATRAWRRDGTVYAFRRQTVTEHGSIFGVECCPLIIDPADSCELDTIADWDACVRRWEQRQTVTSTR